MTYKECEELASQILLKLANSSGYEAQSILADVLDDVYLDGYGDGDMRMRGMS